MIKNVKQYFACWEYRFYSYFSILSKTSYWIIYEVQQPLVVAFQITSYEPYGSILLNGFAYIGFWTFIEHKYAMSNTFWMTIPLCVTFGCKNTLASLMEQESPVLCLLISQILIHCGWRNHQITLLV